MATYLAFHEVDDVDHWLSSPKREEVFGPLGITIRAFKDTQGSKRVGLICEIPDFAAFQEFMQTEPAAEAMKHDGVHPDTVVSSPRDRTSRSQHSEPRPSAGPLPAMPRRTLRLEGHGGREALTAARGVIHQRGRLLGARDWIRHEPCADSAARILGVMRIRRATRGR